jgi:threonine dehydrogenase-like Zn-dependent dehydrogenase
VAKRTGAAPAEKPGCSQAGLSAKESGRPTGWDVVVDATGNAAAVLDGLERVAKAGTVLQIGVSDYATTAESSPYAREAEAESGRHRP